MLVVNMKFTLHHHKPSSSYWNGNKPLPADIHVSSYDPFIVEFELLTILCSLHGHVSAFDILTGAQEHTEKDKDIDAIMNALQMYLYPKMPISNYDGTNDKRIKSKVSSKVIPIDSSPQ
jgi:hypothetical protein